MIKFFCEFSMNKFVFFLLFVFCSQLSAIEIEDESFFDLVQATHGRHKQKQEKYERFVGLGNSCVTRFEINHYLSNRYNLDVSYFGGGQLFDWLVIHNYNFLALALECNLTNFFEKSDLVIEPSVTGQLCVRNAFFNMTWNHLFTRNAANHLDLDIIEREYDIKKRKLDYLAEKFRALKNFRTLYVVTYPHEIDGTFNTLRPDIHTLIRLRNALVNIRGNDNFTLLFCTPTKIYEDISNIQMRAFGGYEDPHAGWKKIFSEFRYTLDKVEVDNSQLDNTF